MVRAFKTTYSLCSLGGQAAFEDVVFSHGIVKVYIILHCFICRPSDSTVLEDAGIEPRTIATLALTARRSNHLAWYCKSNVLRLSSYTEL
jgi:hypothetical protein